MEKLSDLPNIGKVVEQQLSEVGIETYDQLSEIGSKNAWLKIQEIDPSACYNRLLGLEGAIRLTKKAELERDVKDELKQFYNEHKLK